MNPTPRHPPATGGTYTRAPAKPAPAAAAPAPTPKKPTKE